MNPSKMDITNISPNQSHKINVKPLSADLVQLNSQIGWQNKL